MALAEVQLSFHRLAGDHAGVFGRDTGDIVQDPRSPVPMKELLNDRVSLIAVALFGTTLGPLCEELAFRGFMQPLFIRSLGRRAGDRVVGGWIRPAAPAAVRLLLAARHSHRAGGRGVRMDALDLRVHTGLDPHAFRVQFNFVRRILRSREKRTSLMVETIQWTDDGVVMIDQTRLPREEVYVTCRTYGEVADAIRSMVIRGAPAIGVAAAMGGSAGRAPIVRPLRRDLRYAGADASNRRQSFLGYRPDEEAV